MTKNGSANGARDEGDGEGGWATVSGSGSTIIAFTTKNEAAVQAAMEDAFVQAGLTASGHILKVCNEGAKLI